MEKKRIIPGYTGYIPKHHKFEDSTQKVHSNDPKRTIPGYQGYMPAVTAENLHGSTYGKVTESVASGGMHKGIRFPASERFKSATMEAYKDPGIVKMPAYEVVVNHSEAVETRKQTKVPKDVSNRFWGVEASTPLESSTRKFYGS